jgi:release factor glutamine methyltransferase
MKAKISYGDWQKRAVRVLTKAGIDNAQLDVLIMLEDSLNIDRARILAHPEQTIRSSDLKKLDKKLGARKSNEPLGYIRGFTEFWNRKFLVDKNALVPRPESEAFLELLHGLKPVKNQFLADVGTGCGNLAISAKLDFSFLNVFGYDTSGKVLKVASRNARNLGLSLTQINFAESDLLKNIPVKFDYILANLPYVPLNHPVNKAVLFEPKSAVFGLNDGLDLIIKLLEHINDNLKPGGYLMIESLENQHNTILAIAKKHGLIYIKKRGLVLMFKSGY